MNQIGDNSNQQLKSIVERVENLGTQIKELHDDQNEIYLEAKGNGYCPKTLRKIVSMRKKNPSTRAEEAALLETYLHALGMEA